MDVEHMEEAVKNALARDIDRNARAYGWEIGHGQTLKYMVKLTRKNPFRDPNWENHIVREGGIMFKNAFSFITGGVIALAGVVIGTTIKNTPKTSQAAK